MRINGKKIISALLAGVMMTFAAPGVSAATATTAAQTYSVRVSDTNVQLIQNGKVTNTYKTRSSDVVLTSDKTHELYVQFTSDAGKSTSVTLGRQKSLSIGGTMDSLVIRSALPNDIKLSVDKGSVIQKLLHYGKNNLILNGSTELLSLYDHSITSITSTGKAYRVQQRSAGSTLKAAGRVSVLEQVDGATATGSGVSSLTPLIRDEDSDEWGTSKNSSSATLTLRTETLYAYEGETLWELEHDLDSAVRAYNSRGDKIAGDVSFAINNSTVLSRTRTVKYTFYPDDHRYKTTSGTIRIEVTRKPAPNPTPSDLTVFTSASALTTYVFPDIRLGALETDLYYAVSAWDSYGTQVAGTPQWRYPSQRISESGYYDYVFTPSDSRYKSTSGTVYITLLGVNWDDPFLGGDSVIGSGATPD